MNYIAIGVRIRAERLKHNYSQAKLAELTGLSVQHISHVESGTTKVSLPALVKISNALDVSVDEFLCDVQYKSKEVFKDQLAEILRDCDSAELGVMVDMLIALKKSLRTRNMACIRD